MLISTTIINKTKDNFLNEQSGKYLFAPEIVVKGKKIAVREVTNFQVGHGDDINIHFTTMQGLHLHLNMPQENSVTYEDFENNKVVLLSDEAHHINVDTKKNAKQQELLRADSWETTVKKILASSLHNVLLEFTATMNVSNDSIRDKYQDKMLFDYPLKRFRLDGYSKEVKVLQSDRSMQERMLQSLILSQYRRKVFAKHGLLIKPVVLFKSKTIADSNTNQELFFRIIKQLNGDMLHNVQEKGSIVGEALAYFRAQGMSWGHLAQELQEDFAESKCISVNSKEDSEKKQMIINSLEDHDNEYRVVFAVNQLNEGWDVLNLFDIVRLYNTRDAKGNKPGKTTMAEAQLIGRGARYCPFKIEQEDSVFQRKYDSCPTDKEYLRVCETLYYHSLHNPRYIRELYTALENIGIKAPESKEVAVRVKDSFKQTSFYQKGFVFKNEQYKIDKKERKGLPETFLSTIHKITLAGRSTQEDILFDNKTVPVLPSKTRLDKKLLDCGLHVIRRGLSEYPDFCFSRLKDLYPNLSSIREFMSSKSYLGDVRVDVAVDSDDCWDQEAKLTVVRYVLEKLKDVLVREKADYRGSTEFKPFMLKEIFTDKILHIANDKVNDREYGIAQSETTNENLQLNMNDKDWYVFNDNYGTSEEKNFVRYCDGVIKTLKGECQECYLVRNERHLKLYTFDEGRAFEPDFLLFLCKKGTPSLQYQVFIEPKGKHLVPLDQWKQDFLEQLKDKHRIKPLSKNKDYVVWGMPFYSEASRKTFEDAMTDLMNCLGK